MMALVGEHKSGFLFRHLFLRKLLAQVQATLANTAITDCHALAKEADCFFLAGQIGLNVLRLLQLHHCSARFRSRCRRPHYGPDSGRHGAHRSSIAASSAPGGISLTRTLGPELSAVSRLAVTRRRETPQSSLVNGCERWLQLEAAVYSGLFLPAAVFM